MTYNDLQAAVSAYFHRSDLLVRMPAFIKLAEASLFRELNIKALGASLSGTTTNGLITLPADFKAVVRLTVTSGGVESALLYLPAQDGYVAQGSTPDSYAIEGNTLRLFPFAGTGTAYTLYYTPNIQALSGTVTTNWLLDNAFDLYLYATALQVAADLRDAAETAKLTPIVGSLIDSVRRLSERLGQPTMGGLQIRVRR